MKQNLVNAFRDRKQLTLKQIFQKTHFLVLLIALLICGSSLSLLSFFALNSYAQKNLQLIASTISYRVEAGVVFNDQSAIQDSINKISYRDDFSEIKITNMQNKVLAALTHREDNSFGWLVDIFSHAIFIQPTSEPIMHGDKQIGTVRVAGSAAVMTKFLGQVFIGLFFCLIITMISVSYFSLRTHRYIVQSLEKMTTVAYLVREQRAFNLRLPHIEILELNELSQDFNALLEEIELWQNHLRQENYMLAYKAQHDSLTGLANRGFFETHLDALFNQAKNTSLFALLFFDNDRFKEINDTYGHAAGDLVLTQTAVRLKSRLRKQDFLARLGGDEFAAILPQIIDPKNAIKVAEAILEGLNEPIILPNGQKIMIHLSIGIALSSHCATPQQLLAKADSAMYQAKRVPSNSWYLAN